MERLKRLSVLRHIHLSIFWLALNLQGTAVMLLVLPYQVAQLDPATKTAVLGLTVAAGSVFSTILPPLTGRLSDLRGKRRPFLLVGAALAIGGMGGLGRSHSLLPLVLSYLVMNVGTAIATAAYQGYIPDQVPPESTGSASGYMGAMSLLGTVGGLALGGFTAQQPLVFYLILGLALALCALWTATVRERAVIPKNPRIRLEITPDFLWVFVTRALVMLAVSILMTYMEYYLSATLHLSNGLAAMAYLGGLAMIMAALGAVIAGAVSDRVGRIDLVTAATAAMALGPAAVIVFGGPDILLALGILFGLGYGAYLAVDWALAIDVLPANGFVAQNLGVWGIASNLPTVIGPLVGAFLLHLGGGGLAAYRSLFALTALVAVAAAILVRRVRRQVPAGPSLTLS